MEQLEERIEKKIGDIWSTEKRYFLSYWLGFCLERIRDLLVRLIGEFE